MAIRYYIAQIVEGGPGDGNVSVLELLLGSGVTSTDGRADGTLTSGWMLSWADVTDEQHATLKADARVQYIPFETDLGTPLSLPDPISLVPLTKRQALQDKLESQHVPTQDFTLTTTVREVLRRLVRRCLMRQILKTIDYTEGLDTLVRDIPNQKRQAINTRLTEMGFDTSVVGNNDTIREALRKLHAQNVDWNSTPFD